MVELLDTHLENRWIIHPNHANNLDTVHGGEVLKWMDEAGAMSAMRFSGEVVVTASLDQVNFKGPMAVGDIALAEAFVYDTGRTSIRTRVKVYREDPRTADRQLTTESYVVYVAIDDDRSPTPVPDLEVATEAGERLRESALDGAHDRAP